MPAAARPLPPRGDHFRGDSIARSTLGLTLAAGLALAGCAAPPAGPSQLQVVASTAVIADLARNVGGDRARVRALLPAGAEVHTFQPSPRHGEMIAGARVILSNGLGLEAFLQGLLKGAASPGALQVVLSEGISARPFVGAKAVIGTDSAAATPEHAGEGNEGGSDPHLWLSVPNAMAYVARIREAFIQADPAGADLYRRNAASYLDRLAALDQEIVEAVAAVPPPRRKLVTFHDAYGYLAERYGLEVVGFVLKSQGGEPSAAQVAQLVRAIRAQGVPAVFTEPQFNPRILELAAREAGVRVLQLYSDTLDEQSSSYVAMMQANARALVEGLR
ncbi:MAG: zinc ABC transporter substrate-binding protein [Chloroflexi bacterium]|nr:zinc ABC transporter substrate-binding protein [Chloroflexota bacterium]